jgi:hypothetical protein
VDRAGFQVEAGHRIDLLRQRSETLRTLQEGYIGASDKLDPEEWAKRPFRERFVDNVFRLVSPLL